MKSLKSKLAGYKLPKGDKSNLLSFQEYAMKIIKDFGIAKDYQPIIWRFAKRNKCYLEGRVALCVEKFGTKLDDKGAYLISLFRKKK